MKKVLLDTNIVLDFALKREPFYENAQAIFCEIVKGGLEGYITASMVTDIFYLLQKTNGKKFAKDTLADLLVIIDVLTVYREDVYLAQHSGWDDFEDALQTQVAIHSNMDAIVTRNIKGYKKVQHLDILQPADLIPYLGK
ncbi:MAG: PIN domain-containing protein [Dysgonamonadaceae bacterium]|jgi:predicted nucleic acid-binding protein|nr:PIN domain-containing protein [Dysgonamonadaceae bacterium]